MLTRFAVSACLLAMASAALPHTAESAETFPTKAIRFIVPYAPGGGGDVTARLIIDGMRESLGQPVIVENRPGANGGIGINEMLRLPADGYTIVLVSNSAVTMSPHLSEVPYDVAALAPVIRMVDGPLLLSVNADLPVHSVTDLIAYVQSQPAGVNYSANNPGSAAYLAGELFKIRAALNMQAITYGGAAPASLALASGEVPVGISDTASIIPFIEAGRVRPLGISGAERMPSLPDIPTIAESLPGFSASTWLAVVTRRGTPEPVIAKLNAAIAKAVNAPEIREKILTFGMLAADPSSPEDLARLIKEESEQWENLIEEIGLKLE